MNNYDESYLELRNGLKEFMKNCDRALSVNEINDIISRICPEIRNEIEKETAQEICDFIEENHTRDSYYDRWISWIRKHADDVSEERPVCKRSPGDVPYEHDAQIHNGTPGDAYDMPYECAKEYISRRGLDVPINDGDVFVDERYITQTIANVLRWADNNPVPSQQLSGKSGVENIRKELMTPSVTKLMHIVELAVNNSGCTVIPRQKDEISEYFTLLEQMCFNDDSDAAETLKDVVYSYFNDLYFDDCKKPFSEEELTVFIKSENMWKSAQEAVLKMQKMNNRDALFMTIANMVDKSGNLLFRKHGVSREQCVRFVENFLMKGLREETEYEKSIREFLETLLKDDEFRSVAISDSDDADLMLKWIRLNP